jgi:hypothetical protein
MGCLNGAIVLPLDHAAQGTTVDDMASERGFAAVAHVRMFGGYELLGPIVALQVQVESLKRGTRPASWYDPAPITQVPAIRLDSGGVTGVDGETGADVGDVHHRDHAQSKFRGENGISFGFTHHYAAMRDAYGETLHDGIAGENILIANERTITLEMVRHGIVVFTAEGEVALDAVEVAAPCVEFSKFCLGYAPDDRADARVSETLKFLHQGTRGFLATVRPEHETATIRVGDLVYRREG